ncbi:ferritin-like metal-binding protein YciE [Mucilaginibacter gracilis]|uniref:Ferritin-like metal-binding protein YciE n=1 Tax=Mucilaginibacter gracilis TaxID=423350 RepID=A0A495IUQ7_9SPHI|nr:DUF892 family protein [Mucilaginibacter gracilis]RKR80440.1 ferritin-like metal-binding protein YciE [Mucilaginibacter gracilis]
MENQLRSAPKDLTQEELKGFFISHLNRIYCAKSQLIDKLPALVKNSHFLDLKQAIEETIEVVGNQIRRMKEIYIRLDAHYESESCIGLVGILDEAFQSIGKPGDSTGVRDLSILFYMQNIESIEMASFKMMMLVAAQLEQPDIAQLLLECYDEAREDKILFKEITKNYF